MYRCTRARNEHEPEHEPELDSLHGAGTKSVSIIGSFSSWRQCQPQLVSLVRLYPFKTVYLPLSYSGNPEKNGVSYRGVNGGMLGVGMLLWAGLAIIPKFRQLTWYPFAIQVQHHKCVHVVVCMCIHYIHLAIYLCVVCTRYLPDFSDCSSLGCQVLA